MSNSIRAGRRTAAVLALAMATAVALGQGQAPGKKKEEPLRPPQPTKQDSAPIIPTYLTIAILIAACFGAAAMPSKRGHQD